MQSELTNARGFMLVLTQNEPVEEDFIESAIGYRQDYEGIGVYVFRHALRDNKWFAMVLQNNGQRNVLRLDNQMYSGMRNMNHCEIDMEQGVRAGFRLTLENGKIFLEVKDSDDPSYRSCANQNILS